MRKSRWVLTLVVLLGIVVGVADNAGAASNPAQWPMYQSDASNSGHAWRHSGPDDAACVITEEIVSVSWSSPVVVGPDGEIYIAGVGDDGSSHTRRYYIYSLRVSDTKEITVSWRRELRTLAEACPATNEFGNVMVLDNAGNVYGFDAAGNPLWAPRELVIYPGQSKSQAAIRFAEDDPWYAYVYAVNSGHPGVLYKINWASGQIIWQTEKLVGSWNTFGPFLLSHAEKPTIWFAGIVDGERVLASVDPLTGELLGTIDDRLLDVAWYDMLAEASTTRGTAVVLLGNSDRTVAVQAHRNGDYWIAWDISDVSLSRAAVANSTLYILMHGGIDVASVDLLSGEFGREFRIERGLSGDTPPIVDGEQRIYFLANLASKERRRLVCYNAWGALRFDIEIPEGRYMSWNSESMAMVVPDGFSGGYWNMGNGGLITSCIIIPLEAGGMAVVFDRTLW